MSFMIGKIVEKRGRTVDNALKKEGECQVDIVDGDNAAEIAERKRRRV